jgi:hypothetical protein
MSERYEITFAAAPGFRGPPIARLRLVEVGGACLRPESRHLPTCAGRTISRNRGIDFVPCGTSGQRRTYRIVEKQRENR